MCIHYARAYPPGHLWDDYPGKQLCLHCCLPLRLKVYLAEVAIQIILAT
jgi:hypothetical protein